MEILLQREPDEQKLVNPNTNPDPNPNPNPSPNPSPNPNPNPNPNQVAHHVKDAELVDRTVSRYISAGGFGFDISSASSPVNVLESALLLGYPLELAGACPSLSWPTW